ncbi:uL13 family ribosomal protein [Candidatus Kaiserbacteria bacterium]|nr:uL13 family ribosomal protein [Candidatus Kaiserbacteria bacterium]
MAVKTVQQKEERTIDAQGKRLGVVAVEAASLLLGKHSPAFEKRLAYPITLTIVNARLMDISEKKREQEIYKTYSGYPGGQKEETLGHLAIRRGYGEALTRTIGGMLPKNRLHKVRMQNLSIKE